MYTDFLIKGLIRVIRVLIRLPEEIASSGAKRPPICAYGAARQARNDSKRDRSYLWLQSNGRLGEEVKLLPVDELS